MKNIFKSKNFKPMKNMCPQSFSGDMLKLLKSYLNLNFLRWEELRKERIRKSYHQTLKLDPYRLKIMLFYENILFRMKYNNKVYNLLINERKKDLATKKLNEHVPDSLTAEQHKEHPVKKLDIQSRINEVQENIEINNSVNNLLKNIESETEEQYNLHNKTSNIGDDNEGYIQKNISSSKYQKQKTETNKSYMTIISWLYYIFVVAIIFNFIIQDGIKSIFSLRISFILIFVLLMPDVILPFTYNHLIIPTYLNITNLMSK